MTDLSVEQLQSIWSQGHWLARCDRAFSSKSQTERWKELDSISAIKIFQKEYADQNSSDVGWADAIFKALEPANAINIRRSDLTSEVRKNVLNYLKSKQLVAIGFEPPRKLDDVPKFLPLEVWNGTVNWDESSLKYQSLSFVDIRIVAPAWIDKTLSENVSIEKSRGRPSVASDLETCFRSLAVEQKFDFNGSMKSNFPTIRDWLNEHLSADGAEEYKISNEAIRKYFSPYFNKLKSQLKQEVKKP